MTDRWDAIVVGAGLGGLACATDLASRGARVLVVERHGVVGGYASSFSRGQFVFDISQHCVGGLGKGQSFWSLLSRLGVADAVSIASPPTIGRVSSPHGTIDLPNSRQECIEALASTSPAERDALLELLEECSSIHHDTVSGAVENDMRKLVRGMRTAGNRTFEQALKARIKGPWLTSLLSVPWVLVGLPPSRASYSWFSKVIATTFVEGAGLVVGGGQALANALAARLAALGSEVRTGTAALKIRTQGGKAVAVQTQAGDWEQARAIVASLDPWSLAQMIEGDARSMEPVGEPSLSMIALYLGLKNDPSGLGIPAGTTFLSTTADPEHAYRASLRGALEESDIVLSNPTTLDPGCAPPGKGMIHAVALANGRPWFDLEGGAYARRKRESTEALLGRLDRTWPGLRDSIEVQETATPRTMFGYTRNHLGSVYGLAQTQAQSGAKRPGAPTGIPGLFRTGAWVVPGGGYSAATLSGIMTARDVAKHLGIAEEVIAAAPAPQAKLAEDTFQVRIFYEDTDADRVTYHVSYLRFFDRARTEMFTRIALARGVRLPRAVVSKLEVSYHRPCGLGDVLEIRTRGRFASDYRVVFDQRAVLASDSSPVAQAVTDLAFVDEAGNPIPCPIRDILEGP